MHDPRTLFLNFISPLLIISIPNKTNKNAKVYVKYHMFVLKFLKKYIIHHSLQLSTQDQKQRKIIKFM